MSKAEIANNHLAKSLSRHGHKPVRILPQVFITGDQRVGSIGKGIHRALSADGCNVTSFGGDIREPINDADLFVGSSALICCHGLSHMDWFEDAPLDKVREVMDVNLFGSYNIASEFVRQTIDSDVRKKIILVGSMAHRQVLNASSAYCASKAGLAMLARCMAWELTPKGYDVYCIHPSNVDGAPMANDTINGIMEYRGIDREEAEAYWGANYIRGESLSVNDIVGLVRHLLSERHGWLSGSNIELAGGNR